MLLTGGAYAPYATCMATPLYLDIFSEGSQKRGDKYGSNLLIIAHLHILELLKT